MDEKYVQELMSGHNEILELAKMGNHVVGYIAAYNLDMQDDQRRKSTSFSKDFDMSLLRDNKVLYGKHVAIKK
jgi:hypothetical protein